MTSNLSHLLWREDGTKDTMICESARENIADTGEDISVEPPLKHAYVHSVVLLASDCHALRAALTTVHSRSSMENGSTQSPQPKFTVHLPATTRLVGATFDSFVAYLYHHRLLLRGDSEEEPEVDAVVRLILVAHPASSLNRSMDSSSGSII